MYYRANKQYKWGFLTTSDIEIRDLLKAWVAISLAFAIVISGGRIFSPGFITFFLLAAFSVGIGFIVHELGHKVVAQHYGCWAEFRAFNFMLWVAVAMSFLGFVFAAPGAVMIQGPVGIRRNGKISMAGPGMNLLLSVFFLGNLFLLPLTGFLEQLFLYGFAINTFLALFNLIPILNFDGRKILRWNKGVYAIMVFIAFVFMMFQSIYLKVF